MRCRSGLHQRCALRFLPCMHAAARAPPQPWCGTWWSSVLRNTPAPEPVQRASSHSCGHRRPPRSDTQCSVYFARMLVPAGPCAHRTSSRTCARRCRPRWAPGSRPGCARCSTCPSTCRAPWSRTRWSGCARSTARQSPARALRLRPTMPYTAPARAGPSSPQRKACSPALSLSIIIQSAWLPEGVGFL